MGSFKAWKLLSYNFRKLKELKKLGYFKWWPGSFNAGEPERGEKGREAAFPPSVIQIECYSRLLPTRIVFPVLHRRMSALCVL